MILRALLLGGVALVWAWPLARHLRTAMPGGPSDLDVATFVWNVGYVNRALPDAELDDFVNTLATRIASFDNWAISNTKRLVNDASLPPDIEIRAGWDACMASVKRPAAQTRIKALLEQGLQKPGDSEDQLGLYVGRLGLNGELK